MHLRRAARLWHYAWRHLGEHLQERRREPAEVFVRNARHPTEVAPKIALRRVTHPLPEPSDVERRVEAGDAEDDTTHGQDAYACDAGRQHGVAFAPHGSVSRHRRRQNVAFYGPSTAEEPRPLVNVYSWARRLVPRSLDSPTARVSTRGVPVARGNTGKHRGGPDVNPVQGGRFPRTVNLCDLGTPRVASAA